MNDLDRHFILQDNGRKGPYTTAELRQMAGDALLPPQTLTEPESGGSPEALAIVLGRPACPRP
ncbi:hypothetical protein, partial [Zavarzinella formosa]|uniref:hypothetical protein n=1 Tax=Zavarzinella formosa TaxID=360055 RepID=UPI000494F3DC